MFKNIIQDKQTNKQICWAYVNNKPSKQLQGFQFNLPEHDISDMTETVLEKVKKENDETYRKLRESYLTSKFNTYKNGINNSQKSIIYIKQYLDKFIKST